MGLAAAGVLAYANKKSNRKRKNRNTRNGAQHSATPTPGHGSEHGPHRQNHGQQITSSPMQSRNGHSARGGGFGGAVVKEHSQTNNKGQKKQGHSTSGEGTSSQT